MGWYLYYCNIGDLARGHEWSPVYYFAGYVQYVRAVHGKGAHAH